MSKKPRVVLDTNVLISVSLRKTASTLDFIYQALKSQKFILAEYIVSGDPDLLKLKNYKNIKIISPRIFAEFLASKKY